MPGKKAWVVLFKSRMSMELEAVVFLNEPAAVRAAGEEAARLAAEEIDTFGDEASDELKDVVRAAGRNDFAAAWEAWTAYAGDHNPDDSVDIIEAPLAHGPKDWNP